MALAHGGLVNDADTILRGYLALALDNEVNFPREMAQLTLARMYIVAGRAATVLLLLSRLLADAEANARMHSAIEVLVVQALAYDALDDRPRALTVLERVLILAAPEGYIRMFADEGARLATLLRELRAHGAMPAYIDRLLAAFPAAMNAER